VIHIQSQQTDCNTTRQIAKPEDRQDSRTDNVAQCRPTRQTINQKSTARTQSAQREERPTAQSSKVTAEREQLELLLKLVGASYFDAPKTPTKRFKLYASFG
jgi:hypothetical protein